MVLVCGQLFVQELGTKLLSLPVSLILKCIRYIAYTSDVGEAFRPLVPPMVVTGAYAVSWMYLSGDVAYETYKAHRQGPNPLEAANFTEPTRLGMVAVKRAAFQSIASM